jgi:hypothetical protein
MRRLTLRRLRIPEARRRWTAVLDADESDDRPYRLTVFFDDIIVGSGLAALGVVLGIPANRRILVIAGPTNGRFVYYNRTIFKPSAYLGLGGLGNFWHGVIPTGGSQHLGGPSLASFVKLVRLFYPNTDIADRFGKPWLFVPWRPIRPRTQWRRLQVERGNQLVFAQDLVSHFELGNRDVSVNAGNSRHRGSRVWICAGAIHSPALLDRSLGRKVSRPLVSDHVFCYLGRIDRSRTDIAPPRVERTRDGVWFEGRYDDENKALCTLRPARFAFRELDYGIARRSAFGFPLGNSLWRIIRGTSIGLFAEALYNRSGMFANARVQSVYAQIHVPDAHQFHSDRGQVSARKEIILAVVDSVRAKPPWVNMQPSKKPDIFIPSAHLHHSVDVDGLKAAGLDGPTSKVQVVDASALSDVGPDHHSFRLMAKAFERAQAALT